MSYRLPPAEGYVFDFNGTLFWDERQNREAWDYTATAIRGYPYSDSEFSKLNGRTDRDTVLYFLPEADEETLGYWIVFKESYYKEICIRDGLTLSPGSEAVLGSLKKQGVPMTIATSAPEMNMDWYYPMLRLDRFFKRDKLVVSPPGIPSKPDGAIFRLAMERIGVSPSSCCVFEDSASGIEAAARAGAGYIYRIKGQGHSIPGPGRMIELQSFLDIQP